MLAETPTPPYYAVIFSSVRTEDDNGYEAMSRKMIELASKQPGFLGVESAREDLGITVSYWSDLESIKQWKENSKHLKAQNLGHKQWYAAFQVRISKVERQYGI